MTNRLPGKGVRSRSAQRGALEFTQKTKAGGVNKNPLSQSGLDFNWDSFFFHFNFFSPSNQQKREQCFSPGQSWCPWSACRAQAKSASCRGGCHVWRQIQQGRVATHMRKAQQKPQGRLGGCDGWRSSSPLGKVKHQPVAHVGPHFGNNHGYLTQKNGTWAGKLRSFYFIIKRKDFTNYMGIKHQTHKKMVISPSNIGITRQMKVSPSNPPQDLDLISSPLVRM